MENLIYKDHYKILQEAMMKNRDPEIKIVCGDGVYVVNSAHFKLASSFWMKLLGTIPESNSYVLIAPDISVLSISHIGMVNIMTIIWFLLGQGRKLDLFAQFNSFQRL